MKIVKYKYLNNSKYKVYIDNEEYILYEDIIIKYGVLLKKEITKEELDKYLRENSIFENYYKTIKYISLRIRSKKEINNYLTKNNVNNNDRLLLLERLEKEGYINDNLFCQSYIRDSVNLKNDGPLKIINNLQKFGIDDSIINKEINYFDEKIQKEKINKYVDKQIKLNKNKSLMVLKQKLLSNLLLMGYEKELILEYINNIKVDEELLYKKEYEKIYNKLFKKYSGKELEYKIKQSLYQKGFYK